MGPKTKKQLNDLYTRFVSMLHQLGIAIDTEKSRPEIRNLICRGDLEREVDLDALAVGLGLEKVEYEPEQSPFLYYRPDQMECLIMIPTNGKVVITGITKTEKAEDALAHLQSEIEALFASN